MPAHEPEVMPAHEPEAMPAHEPEAMQAREPQDVMPEHQLLEVFTLGDPHPQRLGENLIDFISEAAEQLVLGDIENMDYREIFEGHNEGYQGHALGDQEHAVEAWGQVITVQAEVHEGWGEVATPREQILALSPLPKALPRLRNQRAQRAEVLTSSPYKNIPWKPQLPRDAQVE